MESLMELVVSQVDGGMFTPFFDTMLSGFETNETTDCSARSNRSFQSSRNESFLCKQNVTYVDFGKPLLAWYIRRLNSQVPLFVIAGLLWLLLLVALIGVYAHLTRVRARQTRHGYVVDGQKQLRPLFGLLTFIILLIVIGCLMAILHWAGRARFSGMSELSSNGNDTTTAVEQQQKQQQQRWNNSLTTGRTHMIATFQQTIDAFDNFVEQSIVETNVTVLAVCNEALPDVLGILQTIATDLLDRLAKDFKLTPLLSSFDEFIDLVKLLVTSMRAIMESRDTVVEPLVQFATLIDSARRDLEELTTDACTPTGSSPMPAATVDLCRRISVQLSRLHVGIDPRRLKSDSSVTVVTLLEKMLKLNFSQVEDQVKSAKGQLYGSLELVRKEVRKLFDNLVIEVSNKFGSALTNAKSFRDGLRGAKRDRGFLDAMEIVDRMVHGFSVTLAIGSVAFLIILFLAMFVSIRYLLSFRGSSSPAESGEEISLSFIRPQNDARISNGHCSNPLASLLHNNDVISVGSKQNSREPRDWHSGCLFASSLLVLAALIYAGAVFYAGAEAQMDACRYLTTETGVSYLDRFAYETMTNKLWPLVEVLMPNHLRSLLGLSSDLIPRDMLGTILGQCRNSSVTIFQTLGLSAAGAVVNASQLLRAPFVTSELSKGSEMIQDLVRDLDTNNLIPSDVDDLLQKTLPSFASVIDAENFAPSILELSKPLLLLSDVEFRNLRAELSQLKANLIRANSSDSRPYLIRYRAQKAERSINKWNGTLTIGLKRLLGNFTTLQTNRRLTNLTLGLTADAMALKATLADKYFLLQSIARRYDETLSQHKSTIAEFINDLISRLLSRVGRCGPLRDIFQIPIVWCQVQIKPLPETGIYLMASCAAFYILVHLMLALMYLMKRRTVDRPSAS